MERLFVCFKRKNAGIHGILASIALGLFTASAAFAAAPPIDYPYDRTAIDYVTVEPTPAGVIEADAVEILPQGSPTPQPEYDTSAIELVLPHPTPLPEDEESEYCALIAPWNPLRASVSYVEANGEEVTISVNFPVWGYHAAYRTWVMNFRTTLINRGWRVAVTSLIRNGASMPLETITVRNHDGEDIEMTVPAIPKEEDC